ncbi:NF-kappa-B inhibitor cactus-like [Trichogramma pretiosum]|uniref:NF-kappa-B inhibitor cactus-like n=1 Tax=Trichogramma pretiosum TaxID=7493 RepID=UPI0006C94E72|nr:NF-kappa-B inhibitor cactus-like [Trichogramma pretiosum]
MSLQTSTKQSDEGEKKIDDSDKHQTAATIDSGFLSGNLVRSQASVSSESCCLDCESKNVEPNKLDSITENEQLNLSNFSEPSLDISIGDDDKLDQYYQELDDSGNVEDAEDVDISTILPNNDSDSWKECYTQDDDEGNTKLHVAIMQNFVNLAWYLISLAPHPCLLDFKNNDDQTALHLAAWLNHPTIVRKLILEGACLNVENDRGNTALHIACLSGNFECVKALVTPLSVTEESASSKVVPVTVPQNLELKNYDGETCLHLAVSKGHLDIVRELVKAGANVETKDGRSGQTALHYAVLFGHVEIMRYLIKEARAEIEAETWAGLTPYELVHQEDRLTVELEKLGAIPSGPPYQYSDDSDSGEDDDDEDEFIYLDDDDEDDEDTSSERLSEKEFLDLMRDLTVSGYMGDVPTVILASS